MSATKKSAATPSPKKQRILLVDDHPVMREGLAQVISREPDLMACCEAGTAKEGMDAIAAHKPDLVLLDITLPDKNGLEFIKDLRAVRPDLPVLVVSMHDENLYAERVLRAGGRGYIMKQEGGKRIADAIRRVLRGEISVSPKMSLRLLETFSGDREKRSPIERLTDREFEVFQLIGQGKDNQQIAEHLHLSVKTVDVHRAHIKEKLEIETGPELISFAARWLETQDSGGS